jgi:hypothetical protein
MTKNQSPPYLEPEHSLRINTDQFYFKPYGDFWSSKPLLEQNEIIISHASVEVVNVKPNEKKEPMVNNRKPRKKSLFFSFFNNIQEGPWTPEEHSNFLEGHKALGNQWAIISKCYVKSRDSVWNFFLKLFRFRFVHMHKSISGK